MTGTELALKAGLSNIAYWKDRLIKAGHTRKTLTGGIEYLDSAVDWLKNRPKKKPGRTPEQNRENLYNMLILHGFMPEKVYYTLKRDKKNHPEKGWYYQNKAGHVLFLGKNYNIAVKNMRYYSK